MTITLTEGSRRALDEHLNPSRIRVQPLGPGWSATCPRCSWAMMGPDLPMVHTEAMRHMCLGPRRIAAGTTIVAGTSTMKTVTDARPASDYWRLGQGAFPFEVR